MPWLSFNLPSVATDTPIALSEAVDAAGNKIGARSFTHGYLSLDSGATDIARFGDRGVKASAKVGAAIPMANTVPVVAMGGPSPYNTATTFVSFAGNAAADNVGGTVWEN